MRLNNRERANNSIVAMLARGRVYEYGFGAGYLHRALHLNRNVTDITTIDKDEGGCPQCPHIVADARLVRPMYGTDTVVADLGDDSATDYLRALAREVGSVAVLAFVERPSRLDGELYELGDGRWLLVEGRQETIWPDYTET